MRRQPSTPATGMFRAAAFLTIALDFILSFGKSITKSITLPTPFFTCC